MSAQALHWRADGRAIAISYQYRALQLVAHICVVRHLHSILFTGVGMKVQPGPVMRYQCVVVAPLCQTLACQPPDGRDFVPAANPGRQFACCITNRSARRRRRGSNSMNLETCSQLFIPRVRCVDTHAFQDFVHDMYKVQTRRSYPKSAS